MVSTLPKELIVGLTEENASSAGSVFRRPCQAFPLAYLRDGMVLDSVTSTHINLKCSEFQPIHVNFPEALSSDPKCGEYSGFCTWRRGWAKNPEAEAHDRLPALPG